MVIQPPLQMQADFRKPLQTCLFLIELKLLWQGCLLKPWSSPGFRNTGVYLLHLGRRGCFARASKWTFLTHSYSKTQRPTGPLVNEKS